VEMAEGLIKVTIRQNSGSEFSVSVDPKGTVKQLKEVCSAQAGMTVDE